MAIPTHPTEPPCRPRGLLIVGVVLFLLELGLFGVLAAATHNAFGPMNPPSSTDFVSFYAAGRQALAGDAAAIYDDSAHWAVERAITGEPALPIYWFFYPPSYVTLCALLALPPYLVGFALFMAGGFVLAAWALRRILTERRHWVLFASFPPVFYAIGLGQNSLLSTGLFGFALLVIETRPALAGLLFAAEGFKPHFLPLAVLALIAGRRWRALAAFILGGVALTVLPMALFGTALLTAYPENLRVAARVFAEGAVPYSGQVSSFAAARLLGAGPALAWMAQALMILLAAAAVWRLWRRPDTDPSLRAAGLVAASLMAAPVILFYDLTPLSLAIAWLLKFRRGAPMAAERAAIAVTWLTAGLSLWIAAGLSLPIGWLGPAAILFVVMRANRRLNKSPAQIAPAAPGLGCNPDYERGPAG